MTKLDKGGLIILTPPLNANLDNLWALVTKTIGYPLQLSRVTAQYKEPRKKTHGKKSPPLTKQIESGFKFKKLENMLLQPSYLWCSEAVCLMFCA